MKRNQMGVWCVFVLFFLLGLKFRLECSQNTSERREMILFVLNPVMVVVVVVVE